MSVKSSNLMFHVAVKESNKLGHRQKQRATKRLKNKQLKENAKKLLKKKINTEEVQIQPKNVCSLFIR